MVSLLKARKEPGLIYFHAFEIRSLEVSSPFLMYGTAIVCVGVLSQLAADPTLVRRKLSV